MIQIMRSNKGFTLVELLIVVIILGVLAAVIIPQFGSSTADAKLAALNATLGEMRNATERYYHDHDAVYPGLKKIDGTTALDADCIVSFVQQLTRYSTLAGIPATVKSATAKYGPYIKKQTLPTNPFNDKADIKCDVGEADITVGTTDGLTGWIFYPQTGRLVANDGNHDSN